MRSACCTVGTALVLGLAALAVAPATAQTAKGKKDTRTVPVKADAAVDAYLQTMLTYIADRHDTIRASARAAVRAVGKPALPALKKVAQGSDSASAEAASHLIKSIEHGGHHHWGYAHYGHHHHMGYVRHHHHQAGHHHVGYHHGSDAGWHHHGQEVRSGHTES